MNYILIFFAFVIVLIGILFLIKVALSTKKINKVNNTNQTVIKVSYSPSTEKEVKKIIHMADFPIAIDLAVEHIGKEINMYITAKQKNAIYLKRLVKNHITCEYELKEEDYLVFHHGGETQLLICEMDKSDALQLNFGKIDFSKINTIGESAVLRMIFIPNKKVNIQMIFSAPSKSQLKEIAESMSSVLKNYDCRVSPNKALAIEEFNSPDFLYKIKV